MYSERLKQHFLSPEFILRNEPRYLRGSQNLASTQQGRVHDLRVLDLLVKKTANTEDDWVQDKNLGSVYLR